MRAALAFAAKLHLSSALTVADNLALAYFAAGRPRDDAAIARALAQVGVAELAGRKPHQISGGQAQRVALARARCCAARAAAGRRAHGQPGRRSRCRCPGLRKTSAATCGASLVIATHDQRVVQALAGVPPAAAGPECKPAGPRVETGLESNGHPAPCR